jgi:hypothetical protein
MSKVTKFRAMRGKWGDRLARSSRVFLLGLVVACGVEVIIDWNQTFTEINQLRDQIRQKGVHYAGLVQTAAVEDVQAHELTELTRMSAGILEDEDAEYVRVTDEKGKILHEKTKDGWIASRAHYEHWMERDVSGVLEDPAAFQKRLAESRYRDAPQIWAETLAKISAMVSTPTKPQQRSGLLIFQDRLRDDNHQRDDKTSWMVGTITDAGKNVGAVLVAFDMDRTNKSIRVKYYKGYGMVVFFVALILVQNVIGRRDKLRLLDLESRYASAKAAIREALPSSPFQKESLTIDTALEQCTGPVDGMIFDTCATKTGVRLLVVDPDGDGIDAAAIALHMLKSFRARRKEGIESGLLDELTALGGVTDDIPLTRPINALILDVAEDGSFDAIHGDLASLHVLDGSATSIEPEEQKGEPPPGVVGPLFRSKGTLPLGATLLVAAGGTDSGPVAKVAGTKKEVRIDAGALTRFALRNKGSFNAADAATWTRGKIGALSADDIVIAGVTRAKA